MSTVLLVAKTSAWDWQGSLYQSQFEQGIVALEEYTKIKSAHLEHEQTLHRVRSFLESGGVSFREVRVDSQDWAPDSDTRYVLTVGGDGTLLAASHKVTSSRVTLVGVRSSGSSVGYLCAGGADRIERIVSDVAKGVIPERDASRLCVEVTSASSGQSSFSPPALNDFLFANIVASATTRYRITLGSLKEDHKSSGLWISTPVGSSAGIFAAGGDVMSHDSPTFQFVVRELYRESGKVFKIVKGFFDPDECPLVIENRCQKAVIAADGNHGIIEVSYGDVIKFRRAPSIKLGYL